MIFGVLSVDTSRKFRKIHILGKNTSTNFQKFWDTSTKVPTAPPPPKYQSILGGGDPSTGVHLQTRGEKVGVFLHVFGAEGAAKKF